MKRFSLFLFLLVITNFAFAQKSEKFDIINYTAPVGWEKQSNESAVQFATAKEESICFISIFKSLPAGTDSRKNFDSSWEVLVEEVFAKTGQIEMSESAFANGWTLESGFAEFENEGEKGVALLFNYSGGEKMVNVLFVINSDAFEAEVTSFVESIVLPKLEEAIPVQLPSAESPIVGTWAKGSGSSIRHGDAVTAGNAGYMKDQYVFNADGTYQFYSKSFRYSMTNLLLVRENGNYTISGNNLTLTPKKSVIESWSKLNETDKWGKLISTQNRNLEATTYQFTKHYFSGIDQWNLVLQAPNPTERDGPFSGNTTFSNAYYYAPLSSNNVGVELP